jgi:hypothetical protein
MKVMIATIPMEDLEDRRAYRLRSRNLVVGAWSAETQGFIGVREKFGSLYLFEEYHYDTGAPHGTAHAIEAYDMVPEGIPIEEFVGSFCRECEKPVEGFIKLKPGERKGRGDICAGYTHVHPADRTCEAEGTYCSYLRMNQPLFDFLKPYDEQINAELRAEWDRVNEAAESRRWRPQTEAEWLREQALEPVYEWRKTEGQRVMALPEDERREANKAMSEEYVQRYMEACKATPLPEET